MEQENTMHNVALLAILEAKAGKQEELAAFLKSALPLAVREPATVSWFAFRIDSTRFGIFDTFTDESGRNEHLNGEIAKVLFARAGELLASPPQIERPEILAAK
jgi:quinol monooxygenase YgiN